MKRGAMKPSGFSDRARPTGATGVSTEKTAPLSKTAPQSRPEKLVLRWIYPRTLVDTVLEGSVKLGRDPSKNQVVLDGASTSREHAIVAKSGCAAVVRELGGQNGVFCNAAQVEREAPLVAGSVLRLGGWLAVVMSTAGERVRFCELAPRLFGSETLSAVLELARQFATSELSLLIQGETGAGKELLAAHIHRASGREPFVPVNCGALVESLVEAELFGHERGAFTGAVGARQGLIRKAHGGTLFLDEIADLPVLSQAKLLRAIQEKRVTAVGSSSSIDVDFRVISATHADLSSRVTTGAFRQDLFARLQGAVLHLPSLRERREDILPLFVHFCLEQGMARMPALSVRFVEALSVYSWPMNVRQLKVAAERMVVLHAGRKAWRRRHLLEAHPEMAPEIAAAEAGAPRPDPRVLEPAEETSAPEAARLPRDKASVIRALELAAGNVTQASVRLNVSKQTMYRDMGHYHIDPEVFRPAKPK